MNAKKGIKNGRDTETVSFFNSFSLYDNGYDQFSQNYGGETVRFAIENDHPEIVEVLCDIGNPVIIFGQSPGMTSYLFIKKVTYRQ